MSHSNATATVATRLYCFWALQMAAAFALGASGVVLGTCLNATHESVYPEAKKQALVKAGSSASCDPSTIRTSLYDELSGVPWPAKIDGQCLRNELTAEYSGQTPLQVSLTSKGILLHGTEVDTTALRLG